MNAENFSEFIKDSSHLYQIPYQELKTLVIQYPFCQNLRLLLVEKSRQEDHPDFHRNLELAATYVPDRKVLLKRLLELVPLGSKEENYQLTEEYLELKDLSELKAPIREVQLESPSVPPPVLKPAVREAEAELDFSAFETSLPTPVPTSPPLPHFQLDNSTVDNIAAILAAVENLDFQPVYEVDAVPETSVVVEFEVPEKRPTPAPKTSFSSWLQQFESPQVTLSIQGLIEADTETDSEPRQKKKKNRDLPKTLANQSIEENTEIATETLAALLMKQGHFKKAIAMYERLSQLIPEKRAFFEEKIAEMES